MKKFISALTLSIICSLSLSFLPPILIGGSVSHWGWYLGTFIATFVLGFIPSEQSSINKTTSTAVLMATIIPFVSYTALEIEYPEVKELSVWIWRVLCGVGMLVGVSTTRIAKKDGAIDNWLTWSKIAHSNYIKTYLLIFAIAPMIVKPLNIVDLSDKLSFVFYCYWFCGLSLFIFLILFKILSPSPYVYKSFHQFEKESNSLVEFRFFTQEVVKALDKGRNVPSNEIDNLDKDIKLLKTINNTKSVDRSDVFSILRSRGRYMNPVKRTIIGIFILVPAYLIPLVLFINIMVVAKVPVEMIETSGFFSLLLPK